MGSQSTTYPFRIRLILLSWWAVSLCLPARTALAQTALSQTIATPVILPAAVAFDLQSNLYIAETGNHVIRRVDPLGNITTIAGTTAQGYSGDGGLATAARFDSPQGLAVTASSLYIADTHNHRIRKLDLATHLITTIAGTGAPGFSGDSGPATTATLDLPTALAVDGQGNLYLADTANHRIRRIDLATGLITTVAGTGAQGYAGDTGPATLARIDSPTGLATDNLGNLYLADTHNQRIRRIDAATNIITTIAGTGALGRSGDNTAAISAQLALPHGLTLDPNSNLYFADTANHRIRRIDAVTGLITTIAGTGTQGFSGDTGSAIAAAFNSPRAVTLSANQLAIADSNNNRVRQITPLVSTSPDFILTATGTTTLTIPSGTSATFTFTAQPQGNLNSGITLAASGLPSGATASFNPALLPGGTPSTFAMTIATQKGVALNQFPSTQPKQISPVLAVLFLPIFWISRRTRKLSSLLCASLFFIIVGCGELITPGTPHTLISVIGTATSPTGVPITHTAAVTLTLTLQ